LRLDGNSSILTSKLLAYAKFSGGLYGLTENAGQENYGQRKTSGGKYRTGK